MVTAFSFGKVPEINFGQGKIQLLPKKIKQFGNRLLFVTGISSFSETETGKKIIGILQQECKVEIVNVSGEPTAEFIDNICNSFKNRYFDVVVSIGGGSVIDAGKAISAMLPVEGSVQLYLEGSNSGRPHPGLKIPFIAVPTTAGTGSEMTKNAVLSNVGENGFKRSIRHDNFYPDLTIIDPELTINCPSNVTAASGLDAFTQLLEAYTSTQASALSDCLALEGMKNIEKSLLRAFRNGDDLGARTDMAYAAMLSGIVLSNAGLGAVHGFASSIGALFNIPHGVICGTLVGAINKMNIEKLRISHSSSLMFLKKYIEAGKIFSSEKGKSDDYYIDKFSEHIDKLVDELQIPKLGSYGITISDIDRIVDSTGLKNNPATLNRDNLSTILLSRI